MNSAAGGVMMRMWLSLWATLRHSWRRRETVLYPEVKRSLPARWRGRIVLTRDPDGAERCVACYLCSEEACPTLAIQLTPDFEMCEYGHDDLIYEKDRLLINGTGKDPGYNFYRHAGIATPGKGLGAGEQEKAPVDRDSNLP